MCSGAYVIQYKEVGLALLIAFQQVHCLGCLCGVSYYIIVEVVVQHILQRRAVFVLYYKHITQQGSIVVPLLILLQELDTIRIALQALHQALQQVVLVAAAIQLTVFFY
jgi:hypothetical protein